MTLYVCVAWPQATSALVAVLKDDHKLMQHFSNIQVKLNTFCCTLKI